MQGLQFLVFNILVFSHFLYCGHQPKYIQGLLKSAAARKREYERTVERQVQKEREKEEGEFDDKEAFVTEAYPLTLLQDLSSALLKLNSNDEGLFKHETSDMMSQISKQMVIAVWEGTRSFLGRIKKEQTKQPWTYFIIEK